MGKCIIQIFISGRIDTRRSIDSESTISTSSILRILENLKNHPNRETTAQVYHSIWRKFNRFILKLDEIPQMWEERTKLYCGYLVGKGAKSATIKTYVSAIKKTLELDGYEWDNDKLMLCAITNGCKLENDRVITRLPIRVNLLEVLLYEIGRMHSTQRYLLTMYQTFFLFSYYGMMRVGELAQGPHVAKAKNVHVSLEMQRIMIVLYSSKTHAKESRPQKIKINGFGDSSEGFCPFKISKQYEKLRGGSLTDDEQYFVFRDHSPVKPAHVRTVLKEALSRLGLDPSLYGMHSFRIGRATDLSRYKEPVDSIKHLGRWKSNAIFRYLRD